MSTHLIQLFIALFAISNPFGNLAIFVSLTKNRSAKNSHKAAIHTAIACAVILVIVAWIGVSILDFFGISIQAFQIAGGMIIGLIGLSMLRSQDNPDQEQAQSQHHNSIAVVPMAMPMLAGPGTITALIMHAHFFPTLSGKLAVSGVCLGLSLIIAVVLLFGPIIAKLIGEKGMGIITKMMGLIITAIAVQMVISAVMFLAGKVH